MMHLTAESGLGRALEKFRPLCGKRVAVLEADGLDVERLATLRAAFELAGAEVVVVALERELARAGDEEAIEADVRLQDTAPEVYHALCIPGAARAINALRSSPEALDFTRAFADSGKWIATLDHGPSLLEAVGIAVDRTVTSAPELRADLEKAGATWVSESVIADKQLITARGDAQLEAFVRVATLSFQEKRQGPPPGYH